MELYYYYPFTILMISIRVSVAITSQLNYTTDITCNFTFYRQYK